jgi:Concanavalin A-like lectin/glucanases superfamily
MNASVRMFAILAGLAFVLAAGSAAHATLGPGDIVAWYRLNGDANDNSSNGFNGVNSGATFVSDPMRGTVASFDGSSSKIDVSASNYSITEDPNFQFSVGFWIKPTARQDLGSNGSINDVNPIMGGTGPSRGVIELVGDGSWAGMGGASAYGGIGVNSGGGAGSTSKLGSVDFYDGNWHHVLMQWVDPDGTVAGNTAADAMVYIDGVFAPDANAQTYNGNGSTGAQQFVLGGPVVYSNGGSQNKYFLGELSDVVFFNRQLTAAEVEEAMNLGGPAAVPEPATATLTLLTVGGLLIRRRRAAA